MGCIPSSSNSNNNSPPGSSREQGDQSKASKPLATTLNSKMAAASNVTVPSVVDINSLIENYAWNQFRDIRDARGSEYKHVEREHVMFEIDRRQLQIMNAQPSYERMQKTDEKPYTLFKTVFKNDTSRPHSYSFKTDRSTESVCTVFKEQGYTLGVEAELTLKTPCEILEAKAGFKHEMSFAKGSENSVSETLTWGVDSTIVVPPNCTTTAKLVVEEVHYNGRFTSVTYLAGTVICSVIRRKDNSLLLPVQANIVEIIRDTLNRQTKVAKELRILAKILAEQQVVEMHTKGTCQFQFATEQRVVLHEETRVFDKGCQTEKDENTPHGHGVGHTGFISNLRSPSPFRTDFHYNR